MPLGPLDRQVLREMMVPQVRLDLPAVTVQMDGPEALERPVRPEVTVRMEQLEPQEQAGVTDEQEPPALQAPLVRRESRDRKATPGDRDKMADRVRQERPVVLAELEPPVRLERLEPVASLANKEMREMTEILEQRDLLVKTEDPAKTEQLAPLEARAPRVLPDELAPLERPAQLVLRDRWEQLVKLVAEEVRETLARLELLDLQVRN